MNPRPSTKPLRAAEFYLLLALARQNLHKYALKAVIYNISLHSVNLDETQANRLLTKFHDEGYIEIVGMTPAGKSGKSRKQYSISKIGLIRLQEDTLRLNHALKVATSAGVLDNQTPVDIQRLLLTASPDMLESNT